MKVCQIKNGHFKRYNFGIGVNAKLNVEREEAYTLSHFDSTYLIFRDIKNKIINKLVLRGP